MHIKAFEAIRVLSSHKTRGYAECFKLDKTFLLIY